MDTSCVSQEGWDGEGGFEEGFSFDAPLFPLATESGLLEANDDDAHDDDDDDAHTTPSILYGLVSGQKPSNGHGRSADGNEVWKGRRTGRIRARVSL